MYLFYLVLWYSILVHCDAVKYNYFTVYWYLFRFAVAIEALHYDYFQTIDSIMSGGPNLQGMDSLTAAMQNNIVPDQEYLLQVTFYIKWKTLLFLHLSPCRAPSWTAKWTSWITDCGASVTMSTLTKSHSMRRKWFSQLEVEIIDVWSCEYFFFILGTATQPLTLRVRHSMDPNSEIPWQVQFVFVNNMKRVTCAFD